MARLERYAEAEPVLKAEVRLFPSELRARAALAMLYRATGRTEEADREVETIERIANGGNGRAMAARLRRMFLNRQWRADRGASTQSVYRRRRDVAVCGSLGGGRRRPPRRAPHRLVRSVGVRGDRKCAGVTTVIVQGTLLLYSHFLHCLVNLRDRPVSERILLGYRHRSSRGPDGGALHGR